MAGFHHVEVWVTELESTGAEWGWLLSQVGFTLESEWSDGQTWAPEGGGAYLTLTTSPNVNGSSHDRRRPGVNHLAFHGGSPDHVDAIVADAGEHGWQTLYHDRYPHAGGPDHYAGWLESSAGYKVEIVADQL